MTDKDNIIAETLKVIAQYKGMPLTIRQIYYRLVTAKVIANIMKNYKRLVSILAQARKDGLIPYGAIEDRTRSVHTASVAYRLTDRTQVGFFNEREVGAKAEFDANLDYFRSLDAYYVLPRWFGQPKLVQVWLEKEALSALFQEITDEKGVDLVVCRGYPSLSLLHQAAKGLAKWAQGKEILILYFGDHDPSGKDIQRSLIENLEAEFGVTFTIERVAITKEQIDEYDLVPDPAKTSDARYEGFVAEEGSDEAWELDAIEPDTLKEIITDAIDSHFDDTLVPARDKEEKKRKKEIRKLVDEALGED